MSYTDIVICIGSLPFLETWPPIYRGQERTVRDRLKASQVHHHVCFWYTPCLTDFTFDFIRRPTPPILSPSYWIFVELTLVTPSSWFFFERNQSCYPSHAMLAQKLLAIALLYKVNQHLNFFAKQMVRHWTNDMIFIQIKYSRKPCSVIFWYYFHCSLLFSWKICIFICCCFRLFPIFCQNYYATT
jgi:hypothetical protein